MALFDSKNFNGDVFAAYVEKTPNLSRNELIRSKALKAKQELASKFSDQVGGNYATIPIYAKITGSAKNYNGATDITANSSKTYTQGRIVVGRADAWTEKDFSYDITGGVDFLAQIASQVAEYWDEIDQASLLATLKGIFSMSGTANLEFVNGHTYDITGESTKTFSATTLNTAMQKALGDNKGKFTLTIMHSAVATALENLNLLEYLKYTDATGIERPTEFATLNGRLVLIDDTMPTETTVTNAGTAGVYTIAFTNNSVAGDVVTIDGIDYTCAASGGDYVAGTATETATALKTLLETQYGSTFTISRSTSTLTLTQASNGNGDVPVVSIVNGDTGTQTVIAATTTPGVAATTATKYTTYVLGDGAIEYTNCGAKVAYETDRNPAVNGGEDTLFSRQRKIFAPMGISFTNSALVSPTDAQLQIGSNWSIANSNEGTAEYYPHKAIPIARVITLG